MVRQSKPSAETQLAVKALAAADQRVSFGPLFFMKNLRGLVHDRCPEGTQGNPSVQIHLMSGETLDICHIIGIAPHWIALAVHEEEHPERPSLMRTEMVPYYLIARVSIQTSKHEGAHPIGFNVHSNPEVYGATSAAHEMTPEEALNAVAGIPPAAAPGKSDVPARGSK